MSNHLPQVIEHHYNNRTIYELRNLKFHHLSEHLQHAIILGIPPLVKQINSNDFPNNCQYIHHSALDWLVCRYLKQSLGSNLDLYRFCTSTNYTRLRPEF